MRVACVGQPDSFQGWDWSGWVGGWGASGVGGSRVTRSDAELAQNVVCVPPPQPQVNTGLF